MNTSFLPFYCRDSINLVYDVRVLHQCWIRLLDHFSLDYATLVTLLCALQLRVLEIVGKYAIIENIRSSIVTCFSTRVAFIPHGTRYRKNCKWKFLNNVMTKQHIMGCLIIVGTGIASK